MEAGGVGWMTRKPPGGSAAPETHVEKYHPMSSGKPMKIATRSGFVMAVRANKRRRSGVANSSQKASVEETYSRIAAKVVTTYQPKSCPGIGAEASGTTTRNTNSAMRNTSTALPKMGMRRFIVLHSGRPVYDDLTCRLSVRLNSPL